MGIANPSVLPEPVLDLASVSRPDVASSITITWIGNGVSIPRAARARTTSSDTPRSRKVVITHAPPTRVPPGTGSGPPPGTLSSPATTTGALNDMDDRTQLWNELAAQLGVDSIRSTTE